MKGLGTCVVYFREEERGRWLNRGYGAEKRGMCRARVGIVRIGARPQVEPVWVLIVRESESERGE